MKRYTRLISIFALNMFLCILLNSCNKKTIDEISLPKSKAIINLTSQEFASIAFDNPKEISEADVMKIAKSFISAKEEKELGQLFTKSKTTTASFDVKTKYYYSVNETSLSTKSHKSDIKLPVYEISISDGNEKGLIMVSADERAQKVIAYIPHVDERERFNNPNATYLEAVAKRSVLNNIIEVNNLKDSLRTKTINKISKELNIDSKNVKFDEIKNLISVNNEPLSKFEPIQVPPSQVLSAVMPMCATNWNQTAPYNNQLPVGNIEGYSSPTNYYVGCGPVAIAQILAFLEPSLSVYSTPINWSYLKEYPNISNYDPLDKRTMVGNLMKHVYTISGAYPVFNSAGKVTGVATTETNIENTIKTFANCNSRQNWNSDVVRNSILANRPVVTFGSGTSSDGSTNAHAFVLDGYLLCKLYYGAMSATVNTGTKELVKLYDLYFHANLGWGGISNGYYLINKDTSVDFETSGSTYRSGNLRVLANIVKK